MQTVHSLNLDAVLAVRDPNQLILTCTVCALKMLEKIRAALHDTSGITGLSSREEERIFTVSFEKVHKVLISKD